MTRETLVFIAGLLLVLVPQLGIPSDWKEYFLLAAGIMLMIVGYSLRRSAYLRSIEDGQGEKTTDSFVESNPMEREYDHHDPLEV